MIVPKLARHDASRRDVILRFSPARITRFKEFRSQLRISRGLINFSGYLYGLGDIVPSLGEFTLISSAR